MVAVSLNVLISSVIAFAALIAAGITFTPTYLAGVDSTATAVADLRDNIIVNARVQTANLMLRPVAILETFSNSIQSGAINMSQFTDEARIRFMCNIIIRSEGVEQTTWLDPDSLDGETYTIICGYLPQKAPGQTEPSIMQMNESSGTSPVYPRDPATGIQDFSVPPVANYSFHKKFTKHPTISSYNLTFGKGRPMWLDPKVGFSTTEYSVGISLPDKHGNNESFFTLKVIPSQITSVLHELGLRSRARALAFDVGTEIVLANNWGEATNIAFEGLLNYSLPVSERMKLKSIREFNDPLINDIIDHYGGPASFVSLPSPFADTILDGEDRVFVNIENVTDAYGLNMRVVIAMPELDFMQDAYRARDITVAIVASCVVVMIGLAILISVNITTPIKHIALRMETAAHLGESTESEPISAISEVAQMQHAYGKMIDELQKLKSFLPSAVRTNAYNEEDSGIPNISSSFIEAENPSTADKNEPEVHPSMNHTTNPLQFSSHPVEVKEDRISTVVNYSRIRANVNEFQEVTGTMMLVKLHGCAETTLGAVSETRRGCSSLGGSVHLEACRMLMENTIPFIVKARGSIEQQREDRIVAFFDRGVHAQRAAFCALKIAKSLKQCRCSASVIIHTGVFITGVCGTDDHNVFIVSNQFFDIAPTMAELNQSHLGCDVLATDAVVRCLPVSLVTIPVDNVEFMEQGEQNSIRVFEIVKAPGGTTTSAANIAKELFSSMLKGDYQRAVELSHVSCNEARAVSRQIQRLGILAKTFQEQNGNGYCRALRWSFLLNEEPSPTRTTANQAAGTRFSIDDHVSKDAHVTKEYEGRVQTKKWSESSSTTTDESGDIVNAVASLVNLKAQAGLQVANALSPSVATSPERAEESSLFEMVPPTTLENDPPPSDAMKMGQGFSAAQIEGIVALSESNDTHIPYQFVDVHGNSWLRSQTNKPLGEGAFSKVFNGINAQGDIVALKVIDLDAKTEIGAESFLETEVSVLSEIHHPNLASFISVAISGSMVVLILEFVAGGTLRTVIHSYASLLPRAAVKRFAIHVLDGLQYLHSQGVVHGDIKPENVLVGSDSIAKLTDFGSAVENRISQHLKPKHSDAVMDIRGTAPYVAPEVARGELPTNASDVWSFGVLLHELACGDLPWVHEPAAAKNQIRLFQGLAKRVDDPQSIRPKLVQRLEVDDDVESKQLVDILRACLQEHPSARPTVKDLASFSFFL